MFTYNFLERFLSYIILIDLYNDQIVLCPLFPKYLKYVFDVHKYNIFNFVVHWISTSLSKKHIKVLVKNFLIDT